MDKKSPLADLCKDFRSNITKEVDRVFKVRKLPPCRIYKFFHEVDLSTGVDIQLISVII